MKPTVSVERVEPRTDHTKLRHVDQLTEQERECLQRLSRGNRTDGVDWRAAASLSEYNLIKATDYLSVSYSAQGEGGESVGMNS